MRVDIEPMKPVNTTGRTKAQIVAEAEATWLLSNLVGLETHDENCRCLRCFHQALDRLARRTEEALNDGEAAAAGDADRDELQADAIADPAWVH